MKKTSMSRNSLRKYFLFFIFYFLFSSAGAQTFTQRIQQQVNGQGTVTITQDADIDKLVNTTELAPAGKNSSTANTANPSTATAGSNNVSKPSTLANSPSSEQSQEPVDLSKKVMKGGMKVNGYRVQAFAGGNSRKDRQQAEQTGNNIKAHFGNVPVYVHFYSPRWICRVGNYRTYEEAHQMLVAIRNLGYTQASIVKGKITVQY